MAQNLKQWKDRALKDTLDQELLYVGHVQQIVMLLHQENCDYEKYMEGVQKLTQTSINYYSEQLTMIQGATEAKSSQKKSNVQQIPTTEHPVETGHQIATEHPVETGHQSPSQYLVETGHQSPSQYLVETGHQSPSQYLVKTGHQSPSQYLVETGHKSPTESLAAHSSMQGATSMEDYASIAPELVKIDPEEGQNIVPYFHTVSGYELPGAAPEVVRIDPEEGQNIVPYFHPVSGYELPGAASTSEVRPQTDPNIIYSKFDSFNGFNYFKYYTEHPIKYMAERNGFLSTKEGIPAQFANNTKLLLEIFVMDIPVDLVSFITLNIASKHRELAAHFGILYYNYDIHSSDRYNCSQMWNFVYDKLRIENKGDLTNKELLGICRILEFPRYQVEIIRVKLNRLYEFVIWFMKSMQV